MGRRRSASRHVPDHTHDFAHEHRPRRGRRLVVLLALAGGIAFLLRRNQRKAEIDEGVWHEAPAS
jgi:hypothetical protein